MDALTETAMATKFDIVLDQGSDYRIPFEFRDHDDQLIDWGGYEFQMQIRKTSYAAPVVDELTSENERIVVELDKRRRQLVTLKFPAEVTAQIPAAKYVYDLEAVSSSGLVKRLLEGAFILKGEVTR